MAKSAGAGKGGAKGGKGGGKETIKPPTRRELTDGSKELRKGHPAGGRVLAEKSAAVRQGVVPPSKPKPAAKPPAKPRPPAKPKGKK